MAGYEALVLRGRNTVDRDSCSGQGQEAMCSTMPIRTMVTGNTFQSMVAQGQK
jgi:hypothetical protein